jgi:hypothetical protein
VTVRVASVLLVSFSGSWGYSGTTGRVSAGVTLVDGNGVTTAVGGIDPNFGPTQSSGVASWTGFLSKRLIFSAREPVLVQPGAYRLRLDPAEFLMPCGTAGQWSGIQLAAVAVRPA